MSFIFTQESTLSCVKINASRGCAECIKEGCFTAAHSHWERNKYYIQIQSYEILSNPRILTDANARLLTDANPKIMTDFVDRWKYL